MSVLWDKDWRYKIALDKARLHDIIKFAQQIKNKEASKAMLAEITFFKKHFSIEQVLTALESMTEGEIKSFSRLIRSNLANVIYIPEELEEYYKNIIARQPNEHQELLTFILECGRKTKFFAPLKNYYKIVLGRFYNSVVAKCKQYANNYKSNIKLRMLEEFEISTCLNELKKKIDANPAILNLWGNEHRIPYTLKYNNSYGFGKFRSNVTSGLENTFTVNCPDHKITEEDLHIQYLTNVYPGYGNFVESQFIETANRDIDFGASFVFNGWSTFSAWHIFPSTHTKNLKIINAKIVQLLLNKPSQNLYTQIYRLLINTYEPTIATKILMQITQKPGKFESRFLGAIATEIVIDRNYALNPRNYLERLQKVDITNYFTTLNKL